MNLDMILRTLNIPYDTRESSTRSIYRVDCPYCHRSMKHRDYSGALFPSENSLSYSCFRGCKPSSGGAFRVLSDISGFTISEVYSVVNEYSTTPIKNTPIKTHFKALPVPKDIGCDSLYASYLKGRGFVPESVISKYRLICTPHTPYAYKNGEDKPLDLSNRIIFPVYNDLNQFVSFTGRTIEKDNMLRYVFPKREWCPADAKDIGFGIRGRSDTVVIVEGAVDACKMPCSIACLGIKYSKAFINYITSHYKRAVVLFDPKELRAKLAERNMKNELSMLMDVTHYKYPYDWDIGDCTRVEIERICSDLGVEEDTEHLYKDWKR